MLNLKSAYLYFLAIKISVLKFIKKLYFTSNYYNKSLQTKKPEKFYFYPNPFLLSSFTNHKNFSFKVSNIDQEMFWKDQSSIKDTKNLNNFLWLNLIDRKNDAKIIQKIITIWIYKNDKYKNLIWDSTILSTRVTSWILNSEILLSNKDENFKNYFLQSIINQVNHLKKNYKFEDDSLKKIKILTAIMLSGLVFKDYFENFELNLKELKRIIENYFDKDGFPINRNPNNLLEFSKYLILIKECTKDAQQYVPEYLDEIIEKNIKCLVSIAENNNEIPLFNGSIEISLEEYFNYLKTLNYKEENKADLIGGIKKIKNKKNFIFFDVGSPPPKRFSSYYQSGPLSFEYSSDSHKIITNCGFGSLISKKGEFLSRLTSAQSTLCLNDYSVVEFEKNKLINEAFGTSIKNSFKVYDITHEVREGETSSQATHDAYEKKFGYVHKRKIKLKKDGNLEGVDELIKKKGNTNIDFSIRFHLYPDISAVQTISGDSILIQVKKNKPLFFSSVGNKITLEKSLFFGRNKILNNFCITISGKTNAEDTIINWNIKKDK